MLPVVLDVVTDSDLECAAMRHLLALELLLAEQQ